MNKLFLVSGHSGGGKSTIMKSLMPTEIISFTTRPPRDGEINGRDYNFITKGVFDKLHRENQLVEYTKYAGNYYGLTKHDVESKLSKNHAFCIVDYNGAKQLQKAYKNSVTIFIYTPKVQAIDQMLLRGDSEKNVIKRIKTYKREMKNKKYYDYVIKNNFGEIEATKQIILNIIKSEIKTNDKENWY